MKRVWKSVKFLFAIAIFCLLLPACASFNPPAIQPQKIFGSEDAPVLKLGQTVKVMSWNVQYMASKRYVFWYDLLDESGPDKKPSREAIAATFKEVARVIREEEPDVILLQEMDDNAARTYKEDQLARLLALIPADYKSHSSAFYWKSSFVPHPKIMGRVGMKLSTISKYKIGQSIRHQLALRRVGALRQRFELKRAILETRLPVKGGKDFILMNTHLSAFAQGEDTMQRQVRQVRSLLDKYTGEGFHWIIGGDFNLLAPGKAYGLLQDHKKLYYQERTELEEIIPVYKSIPSLEEINGDESEKWFTHYPNDPAVSGPDRTIDYIFYSDSLQLGHHRVIQKGTLHISDHLPIVAEFTIAPR